MEITDYQFTDNLHDKKSNITSFNLQDGGSKVGGEGFRTLLGVHLKIKLIPLSPLIESY